ncbi:unnamed protein product, partial [Schistosoma curassoni]|uniref:Reverse transcriptase n=1 Tax=Schistosoma curassoni TaxID=6186 RepID=A0A183KYN0_9TREM
RCLRRIADIQWQHHVSNAEVRHRVFGHRDDNAIDVTILKHRLRWLGHVLRMSLQRIVRSVLLYGCETWPLGVEDTHKLLVFDHRCLRNIAGVCWDHRVSNSEVRCRVLGNDDKSFDEVNLHQLRWLGHVLRMPEDR